MGSVLKLDLSGFKEMLERLDKLGGDIKNVVEDALTQAAETIADDTVDAMSTANLPAGGKYSHGETMASIVRHPVVEWQGTYASVGVGFDFDKPGAGGFLITGTPRMAPNHALQAIYKRKKYMKSIQDDMSEIVSEAIVDRMGG